MSESRWLRWAGTGVIALVAVGSVASTAVGAGQRPWEAKACPEEAGDRAKAARSSEPIALADAPEQAWFRLDPRLDRAGALQGQRLAVGLDGARRSRVMDLPPESFAAGPFGRIVLVGSDDETTSRLEAFDVAGECSWAVAQESDVIRRATIAPGGETIYEMRVDRATRADLGVYARAIEGTAPGVRVLEPIVADERFGRTYTTELSWDLSGRRLAVQSCGEAACRTRIYDPLTGSVRVVAEPDLGTIVGFDGDELVIYEACTGLPCPIVTVDVETGGRHVVADAAAIALVATTHDGPRLVYEVLGEAGLTLRAVSLDGSVTTDLGPVREGLRLHAASGVSGTGTSVPDGWVLLGPDGRLPDGGPNALTQLRHVPDGTTVQLDEVAQ